MIIPEGYGQWTAEFTGSGVPTGAAVTCGLINEGALSAAGTWGVVRQALIDSNVMSSFSSACSITNLRVKLGPNATGPMHEEAVTIPGAGSSAATPANFSMLVQKNTNVGGRSGRGRFYWPCIDEDAVDSAGTISPAHVAAAQTNFTALLGELVTGGVTPVVLHADVTFPILPVPVIGFSVQSQGATQRRRLRR